MQDWKIKHKNVTGHPLSAGLRRRPSSAAFCQLKGRVVRRTCSSYGDRCFAAAGSRLWNSLPAHPRQTDVNFEQFKPQLKDIFVGA